MKFDLHWMLSVDGKNRWLHAGNDWGRELVWLDKRHKWWRATYFLPGIGPSKEFATLAAQTEDAEAKITEWLTRAITPRVSDVDAGA